MPEIGELPAAGGGLARIIIGTDVPARVERITHRSTHLKAEPHEPSLSGGEALLCTETPCVITLPYGDHELVFRGTSDAERVSHTTLVVRRDTVVLNHNLGRVHRPAGQSVAWALAVTGVAIASVALGLAEGQAKTGRDATDATIPALAGVGAGTILLGGVVGLASSGTTQAGSSTQWSPRGPAAGASLTLRF